MLQIFLILVIAALWRAGGEEKAKWSGYRDVLIPIILGIYYAIALHWIVGILVCGTANAIRMGYGAYDPEHDDKPSWLASITKDRVGTKIRMIYGAVTAFAIGLPVFVYNAFFFYNTFEPIELFKFVLYIGMNVGIEFLCNKYKANVWVTELGNGAGRGSILLWVK